MSFRLVPKSVTLNDLEQRNGVILRFFSANSGSFRGALRKSPRSLSHFLMSSCYTFDAAVSLVGGCALVTCRVSL